MAVIKITTENFESEVIRSDVPVLLDFYADWCGPCRLLGPVVEQIAEERDDLLVVKVNVDDNPELAKEFGVFSIPTLIVFKDGEVVNKVSGARNKAQILDLVNV